MKLKPGMRLRSQVDGTEVIVVRSPADDTDLELLVTKPGGWCLTVDGVPVTLKEAKPLPASD